MQGCPTADFDGFDQDVYSLWFWWVEAVYDYEFNLATWFWLWLWLVWWCDSDFDSVSTSVTMWPWLWFWLVVRFNMSYISQWLWRAWALDQLMPTTSMIRSFNIFDSDTIAVDELRSPERGVMARTWSEALKPLHPCNNRHKTPFSANTGACSSLLLCVSATGHFLKNWLETSLT